MDSVSLQQTMALIEGGKEFQLVASLTENVPQIRYRKMLMLSKCVIIYKLRIYTTESTLATETVYLWLCHINHNNYN